VPEGRASWSIIPAREPVRLRGWRERTRRVAATPINPADLPWKDAVMLLKEWISQRQQLTAMKRTDIANEFDAVSKLAEESVTNMRLVLANSPTAIQAEGQLRASRWKAEACEEGLQALLGEYRDNDPTTLWLRAKVALVGDALWQTSNDLLMREIDKQTIDEDAWRERARELETRAGELHVTAAVFRRAE
jgi:hypothetical protein